MPLANVNSPRGFTLFRGGGKREPRRQRRTVSAGRGTTLMIGDAYVDAGDGTVTRSTSNADTIIGIVEGIDLAPIAAAPDDSASQDYIPAADAGAIIGIEDQDAEFVVQIDTCAMPGDLGAACEIVDSAGSTTLRQSRQSVTKGAGQFMLMDLLQNPADNGAGPFAKVIVRLRTTQQND